jgi:lipopolysaccharide transport system permease protein
MTHTTTKSLAFDLVLEPRRIQKEYWKDLWRYRGLFYFLALRDILVRYKQAFFGVAWAVLRPLLTMALFTFVFSRLAKLPSEGIPYSIFVLAGMLPWQLFSASLAESSESVVENAPMISKIYFPRMVIPASCIIVNLFDFCISLTVMAVFMFFSRIKPGWPILILPLFLLLAMTLSFGCGLFLSALNVRFRDFRYAIPFLVQLGLYASPVGYSASIVPQKYGLLYICNPMVGIINGFRWSLLGAHSAMLWPSITLSAVVALAALCGGGIYFRRTERTFADII